MPAKLELQFIGTAGSVTEPLTGKILLAGNCEVGRNEDRFLSVGCISADALESEANHLKCQLDEIVRKARRKFNAREGRGIYPEELEFQIGGYTGFSHRIVYLGNGHLGYCYAIREYQWSDPTCITPSQDGWSRFQEALDAIGVWRWKTSYENNHVVDGTSWSLKVKIGDCVVNSSGKNAFPDNTSATDYSLDSEFGRLIHAVQIFTGNRQIM